MRSVIQRVKHCSVTIDNKLYSSIEDGLLVLLGVEDADDDQDINWLVNKIINLRIFNDENGVMNKSVLDMKGEVLVVSQFTLHASTKKGNRPSYLNASKPPVAIPIYESFVKKIAQMLPVKTGQFGADMKVELLNDGPVTICIDTKQKE